MKVTLRDLFWLVLVAAVLCASYVNNARLKAYYNGEFKKVADVMQAQDAWRVELIKTQALNKKLQEQITAASGVTGSTLSTDSN